MASRPKHLKKSNAFPRLAKKANEVKSDSDPTYNCIAFAAGRFDKKIWPTFHPEHWWPPNVQRVDRDEMASLVNLFSAEGYVRCETGDYVAGFEKIALFAMAATGRATHAARQIGPKKWASKLGDWYDIEHTDDAVSGGDYGEIAIFMQRPKPS